VARARGHFSSTTRPPRAGTHCPVQRGDHAGRHAGPSKATCIAWPNYVTTDEVVPLVRNSDPSIAPQARTAAKDGTPLWRSLLGTSRRRETEGEQRAPTGARQIAADGKALVSRTACADTKSHYSARCRTATDCATASDRTGGYSAGRSAGALHRGRAIRGILHRRAI
jgi:hypothetical protein